MNQEEIISIISIPEYYIKEKKDIWYLPAR
jgi:hypothetical protein